jgi:DNA polymerase IIIc chi subunit
VELSSDERLAGLDDRLWSYADESLPAACDGGRGRRRREPGRADDEASDNPNGAQVRVCADGVRIPDALDAYERVILMFDGDDPDALASAREDWKTLQGRSASQRQLLAAGRRPAAGRRKRESCLLPWSPCACLGGRACRLLRRHGRIFLRVR